VVLATYVGRIWWAVLGVRGNVSAAQERSNTMRARTMIKFPGEKRLSIRFHDV